MMKCCYNTVCFIPTPNLEVNKKTESFFKVFKVFQHDFDCPDPNPWSERTLGCSSKRFTTWCLLQTSTGSLKRITWIFDIMFHFGFVQTANLEAKRQLLSGNSCLQGQLANPLKDLPAVHFARC